MQAANHANRQTTFAVEYFGKAAAGTDYVFKVFARQALLVHTKIIASTGSCGSVAWWLAS